MRILLAVVVIAGLFVSLKASAQERAGSAALGAVSGAIVLGPVGAVAGAFIGYSAGPAIAHSWGIGRSAPRQVRRAAQASTGTQEQVVAGATAPPVAKKPQVVAARKTAPPVQGFE